MDKYGAFFEACGEGNIDFVIECIDSDYDVNYVAANGNTPLNMCVEADQLEAAELLLIKGADPNQKLTRRSVIDNHIICSEATAMCFADSVSMASTLLAHGADLSVLDVDGRGIEAWWISCGVNKSMISKFFPNGKTSV